MSNNKPDCFNRPDYKDNFETQDGWKKVSVRRPQGMGFVLMPNMVTIKNVLTTHCRQNEPLGAATIYNWNCEGCNHHFNLKGGDNASQERVSES